MGRFDGRNVIITGASRGIGASIAERFAAEGAALVITARTLDQHDHLAGSLRETAERCARFGTKIVPLVADLSNGDDRARVVPESERALGGPIHILVNNAAAGIHHLSAVMSLKHRRIMFEVNFHAPIDLAQAVIPSMRERGEGWIINLSSGGARLTPGPPFATTVMGTTNGAYGATKAALNRYTNVLAVELYGTGIRINTLEPDKPVATEGAVAHLGDRMDPAAYNRVEVIVEAAVALAECGPDLTGQMCVDEPLLRDLGIAVRTLDGRRELAAR
jgi:NAD(P)-dependent dehydrogenase (short-subunit alcohol dehydrogenase family)